MELYRIEPQNLKGVIGVRIEEPRHFAEKPFVMIPKERRINLQSLKTVTNTVNDIYKHEHIINNNTNDVENTKDVNNHYVNIQNGWRIVGNDYQFSNHMNKGYEEFGLMLI